MGSLGDHDDEIQPVMRNSTLECSDTVTQSFGCQSSPPSLTDKKFKDKDFDEFQFLQSTLPFVDTVPLEDAYETQFMSIAGETQVWDDPDGAENMGTQLLDECDNEVETDGGGTDGTEVLGDTEELSDDDSVKGVGSNPGDQENKLYTTISKQDDRGFKAEFDGLINEQCISELYVSAARLPDKGTPEPKPGSERRDFTSVRAAALRTSGLAARSMAFKGTNSEPCSIKSDGQPSKRHTAEDNGITVLRDSSAFGEEVDQDDFLGKYNVQMKGLRNENKYRVGSSTMRRLFMDDTLAKIEGPNNYTNNANEGVDLPQFPACGHEMVGLSYVDSQEPGELSQTDALDFVDRFLRFNVMDFDQEFDIGRPSTGRKSKPVSNAKGTQSLAKITNLKSTAKERGIFDWDDSREDEGGGEFFTKMKEAFFDIGGRRHRCVTQPQKLRHLDFKGSQAVYETRDKEERLDIHQKVKGLVNSNSELVLHNTARNDKIVKVTETKSRKNLTKELDAQLKIGSSDGMEAAGSDKDILEMLNVGFDTQMAAEAMEELCFGLDGAEHDNKDTNQGTKNMYEDSSRGEKENRAWSKKYFLRKRSSSSSSEVFTRNSKKTKSTGTKLSKEVTVSSWKQAKNVRKQCDTELPKAEMKKAKSNAEGRFATNRIENIDNVRAEVIEQTEEKTTLKRNNLDEVDRCHVIASSSGRISVKKRCLQELDGISTPIAHRTRQRMVTNQLRSGVAPYDSRERIHLNEASTLNDRKQGGSTGGVAFTMFSKEKLSKLDSNQSGALENLKLTEQEYSHQKLTGMNAAVSIDELSYIRGRRTHRNLSGQLNGTCNLHGSVTQFAGQETNEQSPGISDRPKTKAVSCSMDLGIKRKTWSSTCAGPVFRSSDRQSEESLFQKSVDKGGSGDAVLKFNSVDGNAVPKGVVGAFVSKRSGRQSAADTISAGEGAGGNARLEVSPGNRCKPSGVASTTPVSCTTPISAGSPICMGDEYLKQSCRKNLSRSFLMKEINSLVSNGPEPTSTIKDSRRRDMASVRVLFSRHLDENIIKQQKKILTRLGASVASSISGATHFVTDKFVRTKNMLEAIAFGKPVVTHMWLESCGQASCFIDERNYVLRDAKKEKEFGFSLPVSLAHACQRPILQGQKVLITPNTKPGKEILASLVKAVRGLAVERIGRSAFKYDKIPDDLLVLSCEEDYAICVPFLEKGAAVYSSELLLNGIVTQKLEYERHRLFADHVKKTRSTIWLKQDSNQYLRVTKRK